MYFQHHVIFTWNPRYISNFIYVDSTTVYKRMSTRKSTWILCCLFTWHRRGFYGLFWMNAKRDVETLYQSLDTRLTTFDWSIVCGNSRSNSNFDNLINSDRRNVHNIYINFLEYLCIFNEYYT